MTNKKISDITMEDIQSLIDNVVCESKILEYKKELKIESDSDKKEFLADISSFANCIGGDIIFGIEEDEENNPSNVVGIPYDSEDKLIRRLEDFIRQSIQPVIIDIEYKVIALPDNKCILVIRIPQSMVSPHRVEYKGHNKFFTRNSKGKYQMDVSELRIAFNSGLDLDKKIENYKMDRYYQLLSNRYNKLTEDLPIFVVHYIPLSAFNGNTELLSLSKIKDEMNNCSSKALGYGCDKSICIDGISIEYKKGNYSAIAKYKNNGIIEKATTSYFHKQYEFTNICPKKIIDYFNGYQLVNSLITDLNEVKRYYEKMQMNAPVIMCCSVLNAVGFSIPMRDWLEVLNTIDREILCINNLYIEDLSKSSEELLKPIFDSIWNACGYEKCPAYNENGQFIGLN